jgi:hypothetical protein
MEIAIGILVFGIFVDTQFGAEIGAGFPVFA